MCVDATPFQNRMPLLFVRDFGEISRVGPISQAHFDKKGIHVFDAESRGKLEIETLENHNTSTCVVSTHS